MVKIANQCIDVIRLKTLTSSLRFIGAQAHLHHQYFLGLQLMISLEEGREVVGEWMFRLFRRQHDKKFLYSPQKLGLEGSPHAVACEISRALQ